VARQPVAAVAAATADAPADVVVPVLVRRHGRWLVVGTDPLTGLVVFERPLPASARNAQVQWQVAADGSLESVVLLRVGRRQHEWLFSSAGIFLGDRG
jgi:hypothetical protein